MTVPRFTRGQALGASALNRVVDEVNALTSPNAGTGRGEDARQVVIDLQIKALNNATLNGDQYLTCTLPGMTSDPDAREWDVFLPLIYWELARGPVTYTYTDINTRTATDGGTNPDETHHLTQPLIPGEFVKVILRADRVYQMLGDGRNWGVDPP